ncbi:MAG TPA: carboxypeptidase-like regulatory domain-containing protein, partial [Bryobacteraceae bacterium]|nr:carboxypeptidase-like regulatory domain-containing protein [Bryobacteraceae bacterium]
MIPSTAFTLYREQYVYVNQGSVNWNGTNQPLGAGWYPDGLIPFTDPNTGQPIQGAQIEAVPFNLNQYQNQPIWVDLTVPTNATPGTYYGSYTVTANQGSYTGYITATVWHFALPTKPALKSAFLFWTPIDINHHKEMLRNRVSSLRSDPSLQSSLVPYGLQSVGLPFYSGASNGYCSMSAPPSVSSIAASAAQQNPN